MNRTQRRIAGANSRSAALPPKQVDQCCEVLMIPLYNHVTPCVSMAVCILPKAHEGKHRTSEAFGNKEWGS